PDMVIGLIAGGDHALRNAVEFSEDDTKQGWKDLIEAGITKKDALVGIAASGRTPYVIGALQRARDLGLTTASISCNENAPISQLADYPIEIITGPEYLTGSTRLKAGTGQKLVLNMISTAIMIRMGRVKGNRMVDMQLSNKKLVDRGVDILVEELSIDRKDAERLLLKYKSVREAISGFKTV
ncbi:MAG: N-acetylmuramic acid 6-phosphate etherase, partial [Cryomorphaceae bacterium]